MVNASSWRVALAAVSITCVCMGLAGWFLRQLLVAKPIQIPNPSGPQRVELSRFVWRDTKRTRDVSVVLWSPTTQGQPRPLLVLSPAMGRTPQDYSVISADLASHGYLVAGVTPTESAEIDLERPEALQPVVETWVADVRFALDRLESEPGVQNRIDTGRVGVWGHSFGGATAIHALNIDPRFRRAANLDGVPQGTPVMSLTRPLLFVLGASLPPSQKKLNDTILASIHAICESNTASCQIEDHPEAEHMNFSDAGLSPSPIPLLRAHQNLANIDGKAFLYSMAALLRKFFDAM